MAKSLVKADIVPSPSALPVAEVHDEGGQLSPRVVRYPAGPRGAARWRRRAAQAVRLPDSQFKTQKLVPRG